MGKLSIVSPPGAGLKRPEGPAALFSTGRARPVGMNWKSAASGIGQNLLDKYGGDRYDNQSNLVC